MGKKSYKKKKSKLLTPREMVLKAVNSRSGVSIPTRKKHSRAKYLKDKLYGEDDI